MNPSRRSFLAASASLAASAALPPALPASATPAGTVSSGGGFEPWLEIDLAALRHNAREVARLAGGRPVLAVVKNNAYGLGIERVGPILEGAAEVAAMAVVKPDEAIALREVGVRKPILFMGLAEPQDALALAERGVRLAPFSDDAATVLRQVSGRLGRPVPVHFYIDTGMSRLGMPYHRALPWMEALAASGAVEVEGTFTTFTESDAFDPEQLSRFLGLVAEARQRRVPLGSLHAASSHALFLRPDAHLDQVRPGLALYGAYPAEVSDRGRADLRPAFRLRARVARVERLRAGDGVSYGRNYVAERPTWIATIPVGHADGYPRAAVKGAQVGIGGRLYPVIGAVSASHAIVEVGEERTVEVGQEATLIGPDDPALHPNALAERAGISVYDVLMHLGARLPARIL